MQKYTQKHFQECIKKGIENATRIADVEIEEGEEREYVFILSPQGDFSDEKEVRVTVPFDDIPFSLVVDQVDSSIKHTGYVVNTFYMSNWRPKKED